MRRSSRTPRSARRRTTMVRGATALASAVVILAAAQLPAAVAAPAGRLPMVSTADLSIPQQPSVPSAREIDAAKGDAKATQALVDRIEEQLRTATADLESARFEATELQNTYSVALLEQQERQDELADARGKARQAAEYFESVKGQVGQLAGELYRNGGVNPVMTSLLDSSNADDVLYRASTMDALAANRTQTLDSAAQAASLWAEWELYVSRAEEAADDASAAASAAESSAKAASDAQAGLVTRQEDQRRGLLEHLAELRETSVKEEDRRIAALEDAERERKLQALIEESERQAAAAPQAPASAAQPAAPAAAPAAVVPASRDITPAQTAPSRPAAAPAPARSAPAAPARPARPAGQPSSRPAPPPAPPAPEPEPAPAPAPAPTPKPVVAPKPAPAPAPNYSLAQTAINFAVGKANNKKSFYQWAGNGPWGFDCSGLTQQAFGAAGQWIPRTATAQYAQAPHKVPLSQLQAGDLVFWGTEGNFWHVAIYLGDGQVVHAMNPDDGLRVTSIGYMYGTLHTFGARWS
ncbi:C40 family peptidase [Arthrobacter mangrovi]|uniref:C40 family peptidase n=1 Tax=Arthrobacter mangrovi TaxID=2966350 RepID=UPI002231F68C|nr:C40 family peptidase [Arthrobacter mangrovi]